MGLVQIFSASSCPSLLARRLAVEVLREWSRVGEQRLLQLLVAREAVVDAGEDGEKADRVIRTHLTYLTIPRRWQVDALFSWKAYRRYGIWIFPLWAEMLLHLAILTDYWEHTLLGLTPANPFLLAGFHDDDFVWSTAWLACVHGVWVEAVDHV